MRFLRPSPLLAALKNGGFKLVREGWRLSVPKSTANALGGKYRNIYQIRRKPIKFGCMSPCIPGREGVVDFVDFSIHRKNWGIDWKIKNSACSSANPESTLYTPTAGNFGSAPFFWCSPYVKLFQGLDFGTVRVRVRYPVPTATAHMSYGNISSMLRAQSTSTAPVLVHFN